MDTSYLELSLERLGPTIRREDLIEICINPDGRIFAEVRGDLHMHPLGVTLSPTEIRDLGTQIASVAGSTLSSRRPIVSVSIACQGRPIRAQVIQPPVTEGGFAISLRFFSSLPLSEINLSYLHGAPREEEARRAAMARELRAIIATGDIAATLQLCVSEKLNMILAGGTSTGKTVTARKILSLVPDSERILTIEEAAELRPEQSNVVTLLADRDNEARSADALLTAALRLRPDRIVLGEVRGREALTFLEAINTGHGGSLTTLHAETPQLALQRLAIAALKTELPMSHADMLRYIRSSIDVIIQTGRHGGRRGITEIWLPGQDDAQGDTASSPS
ncbi:ATPase, T2SS/T4P/T4SS family [Falsigemmobacter faecalis]|uniref:Type II secretion system protein E n=1 Tax=Falsigemmobacter faecalis TaxID=2488730 RepID=A0A3P3DCB6_9RHOB|nr:ATPase, T2SS/T4P/T4SS family [Falsigemmobacter faecalis]RRH71082.1 type II secretion system protein E [Falsigemmobacter faecalis]